MRNNFRGNTQSAEKLFEKYNTLAKEALSSGDKTLSENLSVFNQKNITLPLGEVNITRKIESFLIIFRSFTNENTLLSQNKKRLFEEEKKEYTLRSLNSLCQNLLNTKKNLKI